MGAKWLVEMVSNNPQFAFNGFQRAGILHALDGKDHEDDDNCDTDDSEEYNSDDETDRDETDSDI